MTQYEIFVHDPDQDVWDHIGVAEAGSARRALDVTIELRTASGWAEGGRYLVVPTTNATVIDREKVETYAVAEIDAREAFDATFDSGPDPQATLTELANDMLGGNTA